jgi:hypothetical protein
MSAHPSTPPAATASPSADPITTCHAGHALEEAGPATVSVRKAARDAVAEEVVAFVAGGEGLTPAGLVPDLRRSAGLPRPPPPPVAMKVRRGRRAWEVVVEHPDGSGESRVRVRRGAEGGKRVLLRYGSLGRAPSS